MHEIRYLKVFTTGMSSVAYMMLCGARDRSCGQQAIGASIATKLQHIPCTWFRLFWQKIRLLWFVRLLTLLIWLLATSSCSHPKVGYLSNNENPTAALNTTSLKWRYWQAGKNSQMRMKVHGRLIQACFIVNSPHFRKKSRYFLTDHMFIHIIVLMFVVSIF